MGGKRCDKPELERRINLVIDLLIAGFRTNEIYHYISTAKKEEGGYKFDWHNISTRQIDVYIQRANEFFRENSDIDRRREVGKAALRYQTIYKKAFFEKEYYSAIRALERMDKILGTEAPIKIDQNMVNLHELLDGLPDDFKEEIYKSVTDESEIQEDSS